MLEQARITWPRPWWWDGLIVSGYVVLAGASIARPELQLAQLAVRGPPEPFALRAVVLLLVCVPAILRTRHPLPALAAVIPFVALDGVLGLSTASLFVLADLLYCAVLLGSPRSSDVVRRGAVAAWCVVVVVLLVVLPDLGEVLRVGLAAAAPLLLPVLWAREVRRGVDEAAFERATATQAARIAELDRDAAVAAEQARIARDLHDSVAGHLSAISLQSQAALRANSDTRDRVLHAVRGDSVRALAEMRALIGVLRAPSDGLAAGTAVPDTTSAVGLAGLDALADSARATGLTVRARAPAAPDLPPAVDLTVYRILQEALTNASRHAPGAAVDLEVSRHDDALVVEVVNDRVVSPPRPGTGTGVEGIRIRAEAVGGRAAVGPADDGRWRVRAVLPVPATEECERAVP